MKKQMAALACVFAATACVIPTQAGELTVAPDGLSPQQALARIRAARQAGDKAHWTVHVKGVNPLAETLVFTPADHDLTIAGEADAALSGGTPLTDWRVAKGGWWEAPIPKRADGKPAYFEELWVNGRRADRARFPNAGDYLTVSNAVQSARTNGAETVYDETTRFLPDALKALGAPTPAEFESAQLCVVTKWSFARRILRGLDAAQGVVRTRTPKKWSNWAAWSKSSSLAWFENLRAGFDSPGEWFYDAAAGKVLYRPLPGEKLAALEAVAPAAGLTRLVDFRGEPKKNAWVRNVTFRNVVFAHAAAPDLDGTAGKPTESAQYQAAQGFDGAVTLEGARRCRFVNCTIRHTGNYAMRFNDGCTSNRVEGCVLEDLGAGGVWMGARQPWFENGRAVTRRVIRPAAPEAVAFNVITNCAIRHAGRFNPEGTGVALTHASDCKVLDCDIRDVYYTGVSVGWTWGFMGSVAQRNEIAYNRIQDLGHRVMSDMGGVYTLGTSYGTRVHDNVIHDVWSFSYGGWALYTDEGSEGIVMENNLCWNTTDGGFHQHYGTGCIIRNNVFAWNRALGAVRMYRAEVQDVPCTLHFVNNVVLVKEGPLCGSGCRRVGGVWANNLWWDVSGRAPVFDDVKGWEAWCRTGKERGSRYADPLFVDAAGGDFRLRPESPAFALGFRPFAAVSNGERAFTAKFSSPNPEPRAVLDVPFSADLRTRKGIAFEFRCDDLAPFSGFSVYLKSGAGWYAGHFSPGLSGEWKTIRVRKSSFGTEGEPAGFGDVEAVRFSGWRGGTNDVRCAVRGIRPYGGGAAAEVLIVAEESPETRGREAFTWADRLDGTLEAIGLETRLVSDRDFEPAMLDGVKIAALPYNRTPPPRLVAALKDFTAKGGKLLVFYTLAWEARGISELLGLEGAGTVRPDGVRDGTGTFGGFARRGKGLEGQPAFSPQASWMACRPKFGADAEVVATWGATPDRAGDVPAIVKTPRGVFVGHVWLGGRTDAPAALMASIVRTLAPELAPALDKRRADLERRQTQERAWLAARPAGPADEFRACWCHSADGLGGAYDWDGSIRLLKENGFNAIIPNLAWGGTAFYASRVLPVDPSVATRGDRLAACLAACRKYGVKCHVWKVCWNPGNKASDKFLKEMAAAGRLQRDFQGVEKKWLCPSHPANREMEIAAMVELAHKGVDGIHFDYVRYPDSNMCYCDGCRARFEARLGRPVAEWPAAVRREGALKRAWEDFRADNVTAVVRETAARVRRETPGVKISAAVFNSVNSCRASVGQDWAAWCREGLLDFACPMNYIESDDLFANAIQTQVAATGGKVPLYPGIGLSTRTPDDVSDAVATARQIEIVRKLGHKGFTVFNFDARAEKALPLLRLGVTK